VGGPGGPDAPSESGSGPADTPGHDAPGAAAAKARELIAELSAQQSPGQQPPRGGTPTIPSQSAGGDLPPAPPGAPASPYLPPDSPVPSFGNRAEGDHDTTDAIPSYAPVEPPGLGFPPLPSDATGHEDETPSPGQWSDGTVPPPPGRMRGSRGADDEIASADPEGGTRRLLPLLLLLVVLAAGGYLGWSQLLNDSSDDTTTAPPVRPSVRASATASTPTVVPTLSAAELAASLKDPHFKHGYDWGKQHGAVPAAQREEVCRTQALKERDSGYPWGAHDRAGCLIAVAGG
jgi:hypothetical protein